MGLFGLTPTITSNPSLRPGNVTLSESATAKFEKAQQDGTLVDFVTDDGETIKLPPDDILIQMRKEELARKANVSKGPPPTKINVKTGSGVPGGFSGASVKQPGSELGKLAAAASTVASQVGQLASLATNPLAAAVLKPLKSAVGAMAAGYKKKMADTKKSAVNFAKPTGIPKLPSAPKINVPKLNIPTLPAAPQSPVLSSPKASGIANAPMIRK